MPELEESGQKVICLTTESDNTLSVLGQEIEIGPGVVRTYVPGAFSRPSKAKPTRNRGRGQLRDNRNNRMVGVCNFEGIARDRQGALIGVPSA